MEPHIGRVVFSFTTAFHSKLRLMRQMGPCGYRRPATMATLNGNMAAFSRGIEISYWDLAHVLLSNFK